MSSENHQSQPSILKFTRPADQGADHAASRVADDEAVQSPTPAAGEKRADTPTDPDVQDGGRKPAEPQPEPENDPQPPEPLFQIDTPPPPAPVIDKELENLLKKVQPIVVNPDDLDAAARHLHHYLSRSLGLQRESRKSAVRAGVYDWHMGDGFAQVYDVLAPTCVGGKRLHKSDAFSLGGAKAQRTKLIQDQIADLEADLKRLKAAVKQEPTIVAAKKKDGEQE